MFDVPLSITTVAGQAVHRLDPAVRRAIALLMPDEQPSAAVETIDPDPKKFPIFRARPATEGIFDKHKQRIFVNRQSPAFADDALLASVLAHEAEHERRANRPDEYDEGPAYNRQLAVLERLRYRNVPYMKLLRAVAKQKNEAR